MSGLREYYSFIMGTAEGRELSIFFFSIHQITLDYFQFEH
jgi:hypothetical protein